MKNRWKKLIAAPLLFAFLCVLPGSGSSQPWLNDADRLLRGDVIISFTESPEQSVDEVQGEILYDADLALVWEVITDYEQWASIFPDLATSEVIKIDGDLVKVAFTINNLWPSPDFNYKVVFTEEKTKALLSYKMEEGNLKTLFGSIQLKAFEDDPNKTRVIYKMTRDTGWFIPFYSPDLANRSIVIERLLSIRREIRERKEKDQDEENDTEIKPKWRKALFWWEKDEDKKEEGPDGQSPDEKEGSDK